MCVYVCVCMCAYVRVCAYVCVSVCVSVCTQDEESDVWYHEGVPELLGARYWIASYSMPRARDRLRLAREEASKPGPEKAGRRQELNKKLRVRECGDGRDSSV